MNPTIYSILLAGLAGIALILPFTGKVYDGRLKLLRRFLWRGWVLICAVGASVLLSYLKDLSVEAENKNTQETRDSLANINQDRRDSLTLANFGEGLAKYALKYDSVSKEVTKIIKDSVKKVIVQNESEPEISANITGEIKTDTLTIKLEYSASQAAIFDLKAMTYLIVRYRNNDLELGRFVYPNVDGDITIDKSVTATRTLTTFELKKIYRIYILTIGKYLSRNGKVYPVKLLSSYYLDKDQDIMPTAKERNWILDAFQKGGVNMN